RLRVALDQNTTPQQMPSSKGALNPDRALSLQARKRFALKRNLLVGRCGRDMRPAWRGNRTEKPARRLLDEKMSQRSGRQGGCHEDHEQHHGVESGLELQVD